MGKEFETGDTVYHRTDELQEPRIVTGVIERPDNVYTYLVSDKEGETECYKIELSSVKTIY
ncbi:protein of unknown function [Tenacibaculum sp. 190524A02b]|uniref:hypothetical protein n=1 Tax=Tenacibaculum vairaonense TaxID=3137860 RepID=UPI0032B17953